MGEFLLRENHVKCCCCQREVCAGELKPRATIENLIDLRKALSARRETEEIEGAHRVKQVYRIDPDVDSGKLRVSWSPGAPGASIFPVSIWLDAETAEWLVLELTRILGK